MRKITAGMILITLALQAAASEIVGRRHFRLYRNRIARASTCGCRICILDALAQRGREELRPTPTCSRAPTAPAE